MEAQMQEVLRRLQGAEQYNQQLVAQLQQQAARSQELETQVQQQGLTYGQRLAEQMERLTTAIAGRPATGERRSLVDVKGLGKPQTFSGKEADFVTWIRKLSNFIAGVYPEARQILAAAAEATEEIRTETFEVEGVEPAKLAEINGQVYSCLLALTETEAFDITVGSGDGEGLESWRRLHRRYDPLTTGRSRGLLREILAPGRARLEDLLGAVERLEDLFRRYQSRRNTDGSRKLLDDDIKMASLESLLPEELERHCHLNRSRLSTYELL